MVASTLHPCFQYVGEEGKVHKVFAEKRPFRASESHCADAKMYEQEAEAEEDTNPERRDRSQTGGEAEEVHGLHQ